ncbi:MAG: hypothetical protein RJA70_2696 [Pseudomonadota bacterium]|jgi:hypothetical protein
MIGRLCSAAALVAGLLSANNAQAEDEPGPFELQPMVGYAVVNLTGFSEDRFLAAAPNLKTAQGRAQVDQNGVEGQLSAMFDASQVPVKGDGLSAGLGAQLSFLVFVLGARYSYAAAGDFDVQSIGADLGLRLGETVAVYGRGGGGLAFVGGMPDGLNVSGYFANIDVGMEVRPWDAVSIGLGLDSHLLFLGTTGQLQAGADALTGKPISAETLGDIDGSAIGFLIRPQLHVTWFL